MVKCKKLLIIPTLAIAVSLSLLFPSCNEDSGELEGAWIKFCNNLQVAGLQILDSEIAKTPLDSAEGYRHLIRLLETAIDIFSENNDPVFPRFNRYPNIPVKIGHDNPDNVYLSSPVSSDYTYRVTGARGSVHFISFNVYNGFIGFDDYDTIRLVSALSTEDLQVEPDGSFEIVLSETEPPDAVNWMPLEPDSKLLVVRKLFNDWENETEGTLQIANVDMEGESSNPLDKDQIINQLGDISKFVGSVNLFFMFAHKNAFNPDAIPVNTIRPPQPGMMAMADPVNETSFTSFKLASDEAMIIEFDITDCAYTNLELGNMWWESLDYTNRQTHLNGFLTVPDSDGKYRYVVAHEDPGVPNWLDTAGRLEGTMFLRWTACSETPENVETAIVKFDEILDYLPAGTPYISEEERKESIKMRQKTMGQRYSP